MSDVNRLEFHKEFQNGFGFDNIKTTNPKKKENFFRQFYFPWPPSLRHSASSDIILPSSFPADSLS